MAVHPHAVQNSVCGLIPELSLQAEDGVWKRGGDKAMEVHWVPLYGDHLVGHGHKGQAGMS